MPTFHHEADAVEEETAVGNVSFPTSITYLEALAGNNQLLEGGSGTVWSCLIWGMDPLSQEPGLECWLGALGSSFTPRKGRGETLPSDLPALCGVVKPIPSWWQEKADRDVLAWQGCSWCPWGVPEQRS